MCFVRTEYLLGNQFLRIKVIHMAVLYNIFMGLNLETLNIFQTNIIKNVYENKQ